MPEWVDMGHAMRRRIGAPSNHLEAAGPTDGRQHATHHEHYNAARAADSSRVSLGDPQIDTPHDVMSDEQAAPMMSSGADRNGASYKVTAHATHFMDPTVGPTIAKGRLVGGTDSGISAEFYSSVSNID
jgi:hypothetical protein